MYRQTNVIIISSYGALSLHSTLLYFSFNYVTLIYSLKILTQLLYFLSNPSYKPRNIWYRTSDTSFQVMNYLFACWCNKTVKSRDKGETQRQQVTDVIILLFHWLGICQLTVFKLCSQCIIYYFIPGDFIHRAVMSLKKGMCLLLWEMSTTQVLYRFLLACRFYVN